MKSLNTIGKDVLRKIFPETIGPGFRSQIKFFDYTIDIHRRMENLYSNFFTKFTNENVNFKPLVFALKFEVWGMELGRVFIPLVMTGENQSSSNKDLRKNLVELICECERIQKTSFSPTHLIAIITTQDKKWEHVHHEVYYLNKWQSEEIANN